MKVSNLYNNSNIGADLRVDDAGSAAAQLKSGDILEGIVTSSGKTTTVEFEQLNNKSVSFASESVSNAYVGQKRRFEVVEASGQKLVLKDLGGLAADIEAKGIISAKVDMSMPKMVEDFSETMGDKEKEDSDSIKRLSDEDYSELAQEGFSIESFKAERLVRALERIKTNRAAKRESTDEQSAKIKETGEKIKKQAAKAVADKYAAHRNIVDSLVEADLPVTDENVDNIINAVVMSADVRSMTDNSMAYLIGQELTPSVINVYRSVYTGSIRRSEISDADWKNLAPAAETIVAEAKDELEAEALGAIENGEQMNRLPEVPTQEDARWFVEYNLPLNKENLIYKKELEELKANGRTEEEVADAAARAIDRGEAADGAVLIERHEPGSRNGGSGSEGGRDRNPEQGPIEELTAKLRLHEIRLSMATASGMQTRLEGIDTDIRGLEAQIEAIRNQIGAFYEALTKELGIDGAESSRAANLAAETASAVGNIAAAPVTLYGMTYSIRQTVTLAQLSDAAKSITVQTGEAELTVQRTQTSFTASLRYEESSTQIRTDLGDSMTKAFRNVDSLLEGENLELTEANRRAVRILGRNSMEITPENIENIKFYDAKVNRMIEGLKPAMVMSMIKRGVNPLELDIDAINDMIAQIESEEGVSEEERFSSFLVRLEENNEITEQARAAYIGIYRLLYQIEKSDGAAIGAAVNSGKTLTLKNLLTEARTRRAGVDAKIDDDTPLAESVFTNSITDQILDGFAGRTAEAVRYNLALAKQAAQITSPEAWSEAVDTEAPESMSLEQLAEKLAAAQSTVSDSDAAQAAANIRSVMSSAAGSKKFLAAIGVDDSVNNIETLEREGEDLTLEFGTAKELADAVTDPEGMSAMFAERAAEAEAEVEGEFLGSIAIISRGRELDETLKKYGLLGDLAKKEHYRMSTAGDTPARINLTVIHSTEGAGTVSLEVSTSSYRVHADLSLTVYEGSHELPKTAEGRIDGRISCDSSGELDAIATPLSSFLTAMREAGYETGDIGTGIDRISPDSYLSRLGELKRRAAAVTAEVENERKKKPATLQLYNIARSFISNFI